ncbi:MAG: response regulator [Elusimicrobiota bacterium]
MKEAVMKRKILVADDEESVQRVLYRALTESHYEVVAAGDGVQALAMAEREAPDLILLDVKMPRKSGWEVLRELRSRPATRSLPVVMLTGCNGMAEEVGGFEMGADDYITKPFNVAELRARVMSLLRRNEIDVSANPLTRLPGSPSIMIEVTRRLQSAVPFAFLYADLDNFKPFNDVYGFARGDGVIRLTAEILQESVRAAAAEGAFLGHVGGDDFVLITRPEDAALAAQHAVSLFDRRIVGYYDASDLSWGGIRALDRMGRTREFPLMTMSIGIVTSENRKFDHYAKVVAIAAEMKSYCKSLQPNRLSRFAFDRRRDSGEIQE